MNKSFAVSMLLVAKSLATTCDEVTSKVDCGFMGIDENGCVEKGCCWKPVQSTFLGESEENGTPWCYKKDDSPPTPPGPVDPICGKVTFKQDCGFSGIDQSGCEAKDCCWVPAEAESNGTPWCFKKDTSNPCPDLDISASDPGFDGDFYDKTYAMYVKNLNIEGSGAVVAAPDHNTPGGSYYYHWMRDGALSMNVFMDINDNDYAKVSDFMDAYQGWVAKVQHKPDENVDVRVEAKFEIPSGDAYAGGWCRPQTDGPGLRARTLAQWGNILLENNKEDQAKEVFNIIKYDLEWVSENWASKGCDLWEEFTSDSFFWGRMGYVDSLKLAAEFATSLNDKDTASQYTSLAGTIADSLSEHWNGTYLYEAKGREQDGAVIHAIASFGKSTVYTPTSQATAATIKQYNQTFCMEWEINRTDNSNKVPGILYGRYPGDSYAGGNPWQLLTAVLAETFYLASQDMFEQSRVHGDFFLTESDHGEWKELLQLGEGSTASDFVTNAKNAGDSVMTRLYSHVKDDGGRIDEQIDRTTGEQKSAKTLTWSHANVLHALHIRNKLVSALGQPQEFIQ